MTDHPVARAWEHSQLVTITVEVPDWMVEYKKHEWADVPDEVANIDHRWVAEAWAENGTANTYDSAREDGWPIPEDG